MRLVVIGYHHITRQESLVESRLYLSRAKFEEQVRCLIELEFPIISTVEEIERFQNTEKTVVMLTFDDGYDNFYKYAFPVLKKLNVSAVLCVSTAKVGLRIYEPDYGHHQSYVTLLQIKEMHESRNVSIQPHGHSHVRLRYMSKRIQHEEIKLSLSYLEKELGVTPDLFCLPYGSFDVTTLKLLKKEGIKYVLTTHDGDNTITSANVRPFVRLNRYAFKSTADINHFREKVVNPEMSLYPNDVSDLQSQG